MQSQGGAVTVSAIPKISASILPRILAVVMVGSPPCPTQVAGRCKSFCNAGDNICEGSGSKGKGGAGGAPKGMGPAKSPKGMGGAAKGSGGMSGMPEMGSSSKNEEDDDDEDTRRKRGNLVTRQAECGAEVQERGHVPAYKGEGAHLAYNKDGYYIKAAACYVLEQWKKNGAAA
jgi:hypothetical protein